MDFIQIERFVKDKKGDQIVASEVICINDIHSFRTWKPGANDTFTEKATLLVMKAINRVTGQRKDDKVIDEKEDLPTILIREDFTSFIKRMNSQNIPGRVITIWDAK